MEARLKQDLPLSDDEYLKKAERFMAQAKKMNDAPIPYMIAAAFINGDRAAALREEIATLRADLARDRERHHEAAEISDYGLPYTVKCPECYAEPGEACYLRLPSTTWRQWPHIMRGELAVKSVDKADALLEPQPAPAPAAQDWKSGEQPRFVMTGGSLWDNQEQCFWKRIESDE